MKLKWTVALNLAWFPALFVAWAAIAGQSGSPVPDNWPVLTRILDVLGVSFVASLLLLLIGGSTVYLSRRWAAVYPILLLLNCGGTVAVCLGELAQTPPKPAFVAPPHNPCWRFGKEILAVDAVGKPIRFGDLVVIRSTPGSDGPLPDTPEQAAQRKAWDRRIVVADGTMQGGALRFHSTDTDLAGDAPRFCLWPDNVVHARLFCVLRDRNAAPSRLRRHRERLRAHISYAFAAASMAAITAGTNQNQESDKYRKAAAVTKVVGKVWANVLFDAAK